MSIAAFSHDSRSVRFNSNPAFVAPASWMQWKLTAVPPKHCLRSKPYTETSYQATFVRLYATLLLGLDRDILRGASTVFLTLDWVFSITDGLMSFLRTQVAAPPMSVLMAS